MTFGQPDQLLNLACKAEIQSGGRGIYASDPLSPDPLIRLQLAQYAPTLNRSFSLSRNKKLNNIGNHPVEETKKMKCYKRLKYKQFLQVSGLCCPQFLSYLAKRFMPLYRALYGDAILVHRFGAPIQPPEINKNIWSLLFL